MNRVLVAASIITTLALAGCSAHPTGGAEPANTAPVAATRADVQWTDYDPALQATIDAQEAAKDCAALQSSFDTADANSTATMTRTGHSSALLMTYIDEGLQLAGCY